LSFNGPPFIEGCGIETEVERVSFQGPGPDNSQLMPFPEGIFRRWYRSIRSPIPIPIRLAIKSPMVSYNPLL
jgi:hypothetical protein